MTVAVVTTTIGIPKNLPAIYEDYPHDDIHFYVVGDNKTPDTKVCDFMWKHIPPEQVTVSSMTDQILWLHDTFKNSKYRRVFQEDNYQRRIIGFLMARQDGAETIIAVDDDNYPQEGFVQTHKNMLGEHISCVISSDTSYVDFTSFMSLPSKAKVRGYPLHLSGVDEYNVDVNTNTDVAVNVGTWIGDPDISALSRVRYGDLKNTVNIPPIVIGDKCFTSMCLQNISFNTDYLVTQYEFPMNVPMGGLTLGRYDDIWAGYVCKKILDALGKHMSVGQPMAIHDRHPHDAKEDFLQEFWGMYINDTFYQRIREIHLQKSNDMQCLFRELVHNMSSGIHFGNTDIEKYFNRVWEDMRMWADMVEMIG